MSTSNTLSKADATKWLLSLGISALLYIVPMLGGISHEGCCFFAITGLAVCFWGFNVLPDALVAVMLPVAYILSGIGKPAQLMATWQSTIIWLVFGGLLTGLILQQTGLARRIALWALHITGGSFRNLIWGIMLAGFIIAPMMPTNVGKCILFGIICISICDALKFEPRSREASIILIAGFLAVQGPRMGMYTAAGEITFVVQLLANAGIEVSWIEFVMHNYIPSIFYTVTSILLLSWVLKPKNAVSAKEWVEKEYSALGPMSFAEKKAAVLFSLLIVLMATDKYHGIDVGWIMMIIGFSGFLPGINLIEHKKFSSVNLGPILFIAGCMSIGIAAKLSGMDKQLASFILPLVQGGSEISTLLFSFGSGISLNFLLTPLAAKSIFIGPLVEVAQTININPIGLCYSFMLGLDQYVLPYEATPLLYIFSTGYVNLKDLMIVLAWRILLTLGLLFLVFYPMWKFTGAL